MQTSENNTNRQAGRQGITFEASCIIAVLVIMPALFFIMNLFRF